MKLKQPEEKEDKLSISKELYSAFSDILQIEEDKLNLIHAAITYCYMHGNMQYKRFLSYLYECCVKNKNCILGYLYMNNITSPTITVHGIKLDEFESFEKIFELLSSAEDEYESVLNDAINAAFKDNNWSAFQYLLKKLDGLDHLCCRALEAVKNNCDLLTLIPCEQHSSDK